VVETTLSSVTVIVVIFETRVFLSVPLDFDRPNAFTRFPPEIPELSSESPAISEVSSVAGGLCFLVLTFFTRSSSPEEFGLSSLLFFFRVFFFRGRIFRIIFFMFFIGGIRSGGRLRGNSRFRFLSVGFRFLSESI